MNNTNIRKRHKSPYLCHGIDLARLITTRMQTVGEDCQDVTTVSVGWALKGTERQQRKSEEEKRRTPTQTKLEQEEEGCVFGG